MSGEIKKAVYSAIETFNGFQPEEKKLKTDDDTVLFSRAGYTKDGKLDSLGLVNLLVLVEEKLKEEFQNKFSLDINEVIEKKEDVLMNIGRLINYLESVKR